mgnify:FL=1
MKKPNLIIKAYNLLKASYKHAKNDFEKTEQTIYNDRVHICSRCTFYDYSDNSCSVCGCPIATKASWQSENCPKGKW